MSIEEIFMRATAHLADSDVKLSDGQRSAFYGLQKQAIDGNCNVPAPPKGNISARGKYEAWNSYNGMPKTAAMQKYVEALQKVDPSFRADGSGGDSGGGSSRASGSGAVLENKDSRVVKEGILYKQKDIFKGWRSRYFVLDESFLHYYASKGDIIPLKSILVLGCTIATVKSTKVGDKEHFPFVIANHKSQKTYNLSVQSQSEADEWVKAIQSVVQHPSPSSHYSGQIDRLMPRRPKPDSELDGKNSPFYPIRDDQALLAIPEKFLPKINKSIQVVTENCNSEEDWTSLFEKEDVKAHWKTTNAGLCVKSETTVMYSLIDVFSLLVNVNRRKDIDYMLSACRTLKKMSNNTTIEYNRFKQVWPTPTRDLCIITHWRLLKDNSVLIVAFSEKYDDLCPLEEGVVRAELIVQGYILSASSSGTRIQFVSQVSGKI
jgi:acyl-CoA-binding protein